MYREIKLRIDPRARETVLQILLAQFGGSDPYPEGAVDSVYFDTDDLDAYALCRSRAPLTLKFRARGYGAGRWSVLQIKSKHQGVISKARCGLAPGAVVSPSCSWERLVDTSSPEGLQVAALSAPWGQLRPCLRVRYRRYRFRVRDERVTFDTDIRFDGFGAHRLGLSRSAQMTESVLEIKTFRASPQIPLLGLLPLVPAGMSKYRTGIVRLGLAANGVARGFDEPAVAAAWDARPKLV